MINEFRQDLVSGEWVLFATGRAKRHVPETEVKAAQPKEDCPFEDPDKSGQEVLATYFNKEKTDWVIKAIKNKFPAVAEGKNAQKTEAGPFHITEAVGSHEIIIFKNHDKKLCDFSEEETTQALKVYQERYAAMIEQDSTKYILIFHNQGFRAGASIAHPHSQIISIPILPPDAKRSIDGSEKFYLDNNKKIYDLMLEWEKKEGKRIVYENDNFIVICPFVSKTPYEMRIFPKDGQAHFYKMSEAFLPTLADALNKTFKKIDVALNNPDFNFFIHTSPIESSHAHEFYTWHIELFPKISMLGGFELGSGINVNVIDPDDSAKLLREAI